MLAGLGQGDGESFLFYIFILTVFANLMSNLLITVALCDNNIGFAFFFLFYAFQIMEMDRQRFFLGNVVFFLIFNFYILYI